MSMLKFLIGWPAKGEKKNVEEATHGATRVNND